jgi:hypothetical protein
VGAKERQLRRISSAISAFESRAGEQSDQVGLAQRRIRPRLGAGRHDGEHPQQQQNGTAHHGRWHPD